MKKKILALAMSAMLVISVTGCSTKELLGGKERDRTTTEKTQINNSSTTGQTSDILQDEAVTKKVDEINQYIDNYFYFEIDKDKQEEAYYDGIMAGLDDPYSVYYTKEEFADLQEDSSGEYVGIGAVVTQDAQMVVTIVRPIPGSPAEEVGLMADDVVVEVDGTDVTDMELSLVVDMLRGVKDTTAHVKVYRPSIKEYKEFDITRRVVENVSVYSKMLDNNIGYIQVTQFYDNTSKEFKAAIDNFESQNVSGLIIDVRDNPGGLVTAVTDMCDYLMDGGTIVTTKDKNGTLLAEYTASKDHKIQVPMVVLTNGNSASASEIFSGAMQDTGLAKLVGTQTFGKGIVQSVIPLSDGTAIKITIAKYFTPNGTDIHKIGIKPDYEVELADGRTNAVNLEYEDDLQLHKAEEVIQTMVK